MGRPRWLGGYIRDDGVYMLERQIEGRRFHLSTRCRTERAALKQLERFEADPDGFTVRTEIPQAVRFGKDLILAFQAWHLDVKKVSREHSRDVTGYLFDWLEDLGRVDLRKVELRQLRQVLDTRETCRAYRIASIKVFYGWLRKERMALRNTEDPTLDLPVPQSIPEKRRRRKAIDFERAVKVAALLDPDTRDCLVVLGATGWHVRELERFIRGEGSEIVYPPNGGAVLAVLVTPHKSGEPTRTPLQHKAHVDAAVRLRERGRVPRRLNEKIKAACRQAGVPEFTLGVMRHTVTTWANEDGASVPSIAEFVGHKDERTTRRVYIDLAVPTATIPVRLLN